MEDLLRGSDKFEKSQQRVNEFLEKAIIESEHETKRRRLRAHEPTGVAVSCEPGGTSGSSPGASSSAMDTSEKHGGPKSVRTSCDSEPNSKRTKVSDDIEMGAVSEEMGEAECDTLDTKTGEILDPGLVAAARSEEMRYMNDIGMFEDACDEECYAKTGKPPVDTKWVDVNKRTLQEPVIRCRLVARDFKPKGESAREDVFAAMPPLEAKKVLLSIAASHPWVMRNGRLQRPKLMFIDVKKAHLNGVVGLEEYAYVKMPCDPPGHCRRLRRWLYGMRHAASAWEEDFSNKLAECGLMAGESSPVVFSGFGGDVRCVVHGDDFTLLAFEDQLRRVEETMRSHYSLVVRSVLGPGLDDMKEISILGRKLVWTTGGIVYEADPAHAKKIIEELGLHPSSNGLEKPCVRETLAEIEQGTDELEPFRCHAISEYCSTRELFVIGSSRFAIRSEGTVSYDGEADDRMLEKAQEVGKVSCELPTPHREIRGHWDRPQ